MSKYQDGVDISVVALSSGQEPVSRESSDWGYPLFLTPREVEAYVSVKKNIDNRNDSEIADTVYRSFGDFEESHYALCRWLRARKYDVQDTIKMIEEATSMRGIPKSKNFYPDPKEALGCPQSVYLAQYPQMCVGVSKQKHPVYISKPGILNVNGLECITSIQGIINYHWFDMYHNFGRVLKSSWRTSDYNRFECVCIIDLEGLSPSNITKRCLNIVKLQSEIDSLCFPETLNRLVVVNAPSFFTMTWKIIKNWIDARTANKVEIYSTKSKWQPRLLQIIPSEQLPKDYGGTSTSTKSLMQESARNESDTFVREVIELLSVRGSTQISVELEIDEELILSVYTRALGSGEISVSDSNGLLTRKKIQHNGLGGKEEDNSPPTSVTFDPIHRNGKLTISVKCNSNFYASKYLVVSSIRRPNASPEKPFTANLTQNSSINSILRSPIGSKRINSSSRRPITESLEEKKSRHSNVIYLSSPPTSPCSIGSQKSAVIVAKPWACGIALPSLKDLF